MKRLREPTSPSSNDSTKRSIKSKITIDNMSIKKDISLNGEEQKEDTAVVTMQHPTSLGREIEQRLSTTPGRAIESGTGLHDASCKEEERVSDKAIGDSIGSHENQTELNDRGLLPHLHHFSTNSSAITSNQGGKAYSDTVIDTSLHDGNPHGRKRTRSNDFIDHRQIQNTNANSILSSLDIPPSRLPHQNNLTNDVEITRSRLGLTIDPRQILQAQRSTGGIGLSQGLQQQRGNEPTTMQQPQQLLDLMMRNASSEAPTNSSFLTQPSASLSNISAIRRRGLLLNAAAQQHQQAMELNNSNMTNMLPPALLHGNNGHSNSFIMRGLSEPLSPQLRLQENNLLSSYGQPFPHSSNTYLNHNAMSLVHRPPHSNNYFIQDQTNSAMNNPFFHTANSTSGIAIGDTQQPQDLLSSATSYHQFLMPPQANPPFPATAEQLRQLNQELMVSTLGRRENDFSSTSNRNLSNSYRASDNHVGPKRPKMTSEEHAKNKELQKEIRERPFICLGQEDDKDRLSEFLCFLRAECIEVFKATKADVYERRRSKKVNLDQVGIRCRFCVNLPLPERVGRSSSFPSSLDRIYQSVTMMIREHYPKCTMMLPEVREKYQMYRNSNTRRKKGEIVLESKSYWVNSAASLGMYDTDDGGIKLNSDQLPTNETTEDVTADSIADGNTENITTSDGNTENVVADSTASASVLPPAATTKTTPNGSNGSNGSNDSHDSNESSLDKNG